MHYSSKGKESKQYQTNSSISSSPSQTEATISKPKAFIRKPANAPLGITIEKKKKFFENSFDVMSLVKLPQENSRAMSQIGDISESRLRFQTQHVNIKQNLLRRDEEQKKNRELLFVPKSQSIHIKSANLIQRRSSRNKTEFYNQNEDLRINAPSKSTINTPCKQKSNRMDMSFDKCEFKKKWSYKALANYSTIDNQRAKEVSTQAFNATDKPYFEKTLLLQCSYCSNNKKKASILEEKLSKLQYQYEIKLQTIKELTEKCSNLTKESFLQTQKLQKTIEYQRINQQQFNMQKEELLKRIDSFKKDVLRLNQNIKYKQIEKSMLLRYKDEYQLITKECDKLNYENDLFKKQIIAFNSKDYSNGFSKYQNSPQPQECKGNFTKKLQNSSSIYYDCEDDGISIVSFNLSENSLEHI